MDAPTETQFDLPVQKRNSRDSVKALDGAKKWASKITGLMMAGHGMLAFVTRDGLGSGPNLSCTVLYLGLLHMIAQGWPIGEKFNILLDNTSGDNKNNDVIFFLAWLVATGAMTEASFFCMMKGHTYSPRLPAPMRYPSHASPALADSCSSSFSRAMTRCLPSTGRRLSKTLVFGVSQTSFDVLRGLRDPERLSFVGMHRL